MEHQVWTATGLSCSHCINSISTNLLKIDGLDNVEIDLKPNEKSFIRTSGSREISAERSQMPYAKQGNISFLNEAVVK